MAVKIVKLKGYRTGKPRCMIDRHSDSHALGHAGQVLEVLLGAKYAETGSAEIALNAAAAAGFRDALLHGKIAVLEPIMRLEVRCPEEYLGGVMKNLGGRRAIVEETKFTNRIVLIRGSVPLAEMFGYSTTIRSLSQGRASFNLEPLEYRPVPDSLLPTFQRNL